MSKSSIRINIDKFGPILVSGKIKYIAGALVNILQSSKSKDIKTFTRSKGGGYYAMLEIQ